MDFFCVLKLENIEVHDLVDEDEAIDHERSDELS